MVCETCTNLHKHKYDYIKNGYYTKTYQNYFCGYKIGIPYRMLFEDDITDYTEHELQVEFNRKCFIYSLRLITGIIFLPLTVLYIPLATLDCFFLTKKNLQHLLLLQIEKDNTDDFQLQLEVRHIYIESNIELRPSFY